MQYLEGFDLPSSDAEDGFLMYSPMLDMSCYTQSNIHPFRFFS